MSTILHCKQVFKENKTTNKQFAFVQRISDTENGMAKRYAFFSEEHSNCSGHDVYVNQNGEEVNVTFTDTVREFPRYQWSSAKCVGCADGLKYVRSENRDLKPERRLFAFFSQKHSDDSGHNVFIDGEKNEVFVTHITSDPEGKSYVWDDKKYVGEKSHLVHIRNDKIFIMTCGAVAGEPDHFTPQFAPPKRHYTKHKTFSRS